MKLKELIYSLDCPTEGMEDIEVTGVVCNSKEVSAGNLFAAIGGGKKDVLPFIKEAAEKGASVVVTEKAAAGTACPQVVVKDARSALARISDRFFNKPTKKLKTVGVTGTNGKTTVTYLIESVFREAGLVCGVIGTVNYRYGAKLLPAPWTTPDAPALQKLLRDMVDSGVTHCVMEVSSHAIDQLRVEGVRFGVKIFTNLTAEHLDYHHTMEEYFEAKAKFFTSPSFDPGRAVAIINIDDKWGAELKKNTRASLGYSLGRNADIWPTDYSVTEDGISAAIYTPRGTVTVRSPLVGEHNLYNILASVGAGCVLGFDLDIIGRGVSELKSVPGRLERIGVSPTAYVDYAHTPDALEKTLSVLTGSSKGRIITVFGCGGNRDRTKRPLMGAISARFSHMTILTSDNPRDEDPLEIIKEIEKGLGGVKKYQAAGVSALDRGYMVIPDRLEAIRKAVEIAGKADTVLVAGKGHEDYQIVKGARFPFDDREALKGFLKGAAKEEVFQR
ncbi:MAG: UDP-N-acetylmuramoyl-L-alanyl-D-glutamate--2,6-diaminopimelate ligase [Deltaproteobacteria bacterium]|nr:UDP-N-acetylmuramoyl-L-alanyl-D-glutamate--2,6-diaminopimelate ligase [Deltaproteobacteria bacterium]